MSPNLNTRGTIVLGGTESDAHVVPLYLIALELESRGYVVRNLRGFNSAAAFAAAVGETQAKALVISNNNGAAYDDLLGLPEALAGLKRAADFPVVVGGHYHVGVGDPKAAQEALSRLGVTHFISSIDGLMRFLEAQP